MTNESNAPTISARLRHVRWPAAARLRSLPAWPGWRDSSAWLILAALSAIVCTSLPPIGFLPPTAAGREAAAVLVTAQTTIAAIGVAVMVFVLQGMHAAEIDSVHVRDEYEHHIAASPRMFAILALSGLSVGSYLLMQPAGPTARWLWPVSAGNLILPVLLNTLLTLHLTWQFFATAQRLSRTTEIRRLERLVVSRIVAESVDGFIRRLGGARQSDLPSLSTLFRHDPAEDVVDEALQVHFDALRRSMSDSRLTDYQHGFQGLRNYVQSAVERFQSQGMTFGPPGSDPWWQPLRGIRDKLLWLKTDVFRSTGWSPYVRELTSFDYWQMSRGLRWRCGELYGTGMAGWRASYASAARLNDPEVARLIIQSTWRLTADAVTYLIFREDDEDVDALRPVTERLNLANAADLEYLYVLVSELEQQLSLAMLLDKPFDFAEFHRGFNDFLRQLSLSTRELEEFEGAGRQTMERIRQLRRLALLGLAGRAVTLAREGRIADPQPYLDVMREQYSSVSDLTKDYVGSFDDSTAGRFSWADWEGEGKPPLEAYTVDTEKYPALGFVIRALEFASDTDIQLPMEGRAERARNRVANVLADAMQSARTVGLGRLDEAKNRLERALQEAGQADARTEEDAVIASELDEERVQTFAADFLAGRYAASVLEPIFGRFGAFEFTHLQTPDDRVGFGWFVQIRKDLFTAAPGNVRMFGAERHGFDFERSLVSQLAAVIEQNSSQQRTLRSAEDLRSALDDAQRALEAQHIIAILIGDWSEVTSELRYRGVEWFKVNTGTNRLLPTALLLGEYRDQSVLLLNESGPRRLLVLDPENWGCIEKAVTSDGEFVFSIRGIDDNRAADILTSRQPAPPDEERQAEIRKLRMSVEWRFLERIRFHQKNPERALVFVDPAGSAGSSPAPA